MALDGLLKSCNRYLIHMPYILAVVAITDSARPNICMTVLVVIRKG